MIAAFVDDEQRGVGVASEVPVFLGNGYAFLMMVYSNATGGESMTFKYYDSVNDNVYVRGRFTESGTPNTTSNYDHAYKNMYSSAFSNSNYPNRTFFYMANNYIGTGTQEQFNAVCYIFNSQASDEYTFITNENIREIVNRYLSYNVNIRSETIEIYGSINTWNVSNVTDMNRLFKNHEYFNEDISTWNVSNVINMQGMFENASSFNQPLNNWDVSNVTNMEGMFYNAKSFNQYINSWDVSNGKNMSYMFYNAKSYNQPLNKWNVFNVRNMMYMFWYCESFNQPLNDWDVSSVINMKYMFTGTSYNQPLNNWDVSNVREMIGMFQNVTFYTQDISTWNTSKVIDIYYRNHDGFFSNDDGFLNNYNY